MIDRGFMKKQKLNKNVRFFKNSMFKRINAYYAIKDIFNYVNRNLVYSLKNVRAGMESHRIFDPFT